MSSFGRKTKPSVVVNKRREKRSETAVSAAVSTTTARTSATLVDLSTSGAGLLSPAPPRRGRDIELRINGRTLFGDVAWTRDNAFGLRFAEALDERSWRDVVRAVAEAEAEQRSTSAAAHRDTALED